MSTIGTIGTMGSQSGMYSMQGMHRRPDPAQLAGKLFEKLDGNDQGYLQKTDFAAAFDTISSGTGSTVDVDTLFTQLDSDSDGKVTQQEFSDSVSKLAEQLDEQFQSMRMQQAMGGAGGMPPPPPPPDDGGFTKDELSSQLAEIDSADSKRAELISTIVENFDAADADGDGKVSFREAMAYEKSNSTEASTGTDATSANATAASTTASADERRVLHQLLRLMQAYGIGAQTSESTASSLSLTV